MQRQGLIVIISSPGGGGKDSVIRGLIKIFKKSTKLITVTSRAKRPREKEGVDQFFISAEEFEKKLKAGYFVEYNKCAGNYYGTPKKLLAELKNDYEIVFTNIDVNGKRHFDELGIPHLSIFLLPENPEQLRERATRRGGMTSEMIEERVKLGLEEIDKSKTYDYRIVNHEGEIDKTILKIAKIIKKHLADHSSK